MIYAKKNTKDNTKEKHFAKIDQYILDINAIIRKICRDQVVKTTTDDRGFDIYTEGEIKSLYDSTIITILNKFITISQDCERIYIQECAKAGKELVS